MDSKDFVALIRLQSELMLKGMAIDIDTVLKPALLALVNFVLQAEREKREKSCGP